MVEDRERSFQAGRGYCVARHGREDSAHGNSLPIVVIVSLDRITITVKAVKLEIYSWSAGAGIINSAA